MRAAAPEATAQEEVAREALARLQRANRLLEPTEAPDGPTAADVLTRRLRSGQPIAPSALEELLETVDRREKQAIAQLARQFRMQAYRTFRPRRGIFTRRRAAWNRVLKSWQDAGADFDQQELLIDWLQLAIKRSTPDTAGPMPPEPTFRTVSAVVGAVATREPTETTDWDALAESFSEPHVTADGGLRQNRRPAVTWPQPRRRPDLPLSNPRQPSVGSPDATAAAQSLAVPTRPRRIAEGLPEFENNDRMRPLAAATGPRADGRPNFELAVQSPVPSTFVAPSTSAEFATSIASVRNHTEPALSTLEQPKADTALHADAAPAVSHVAPKTRWPVDSAQQLATADPKSRPTPSPLGPPAMVAAAGSAPLLTMDDPFRELPAAAPSTQDVAGSAAPAGDVSEDLPGQIEQLASVPDLHLAGGAASVEAPAVTSPRRIEPPQSAVAERRGENPSRIAGNPEARLPGSLVYPSRETAALANLATPTTTDGLSAETQSPQPPAVVAQATDGTVPPSASVNLDELIARIVGSNLALRAVEAELDESRDWDARRLGPLVERLRSVVARGNDLMLIRDLLPERQRSLVGRLESPQPAVAQLATRIFEARTRAASAAYRGSVRDRLELQTLDVLSRELARIATGG